MAEEEHKFHENAEEHGKKGERLIMFSGTECSHCKEMYPLVDDLEKETGVNVTRLEVWHNAEHAKLLEEYDNDGQGNKVCGGIPFFVNEKTGKKICGNTTIEKLKEWATGN
jgi:thiol-disulfide isomerase/thioredoxin